MMASFYLFMSLLVYSVRSDLSVIKIDCKKLTNIEAIVNPANKDLLHFGGIAAALSQAAGPKLQKFSNLYIQTHGSLKIGSAILDDAYELHSNGIQYIIHAVGPDCRIPKQYKHRKKLLEKTLDSIFTLCIKNNITSIAIPAISTGIFRFPINEAMNIYRRKLQTFLRKHPHITITLFAYDQATYDQLLRMSRKIVNN